MEALVVRRGLVQGMGVQKTGVEVVAVVSEDVETLGGAGDLAVVVVLLGQSKKNK